jgi:hypothetical protein
MASQFEQSNWLELPLVCSHCGNHGEPDGVWEANGWTPFKLVEEVVRSWAFAAADVDGQLRLTADTSSELIDWESGTNLRVECMQCFGSFHLPENASVAFE